MIKSKNFDKVKYYFDNGLWSLYRVTEAVKKGWITIDEFEEITGQPYNE